MLNSRLALLITDVLVELVIEDEPRNTYSAKALLLILLMAMLKARDWRKSWLARRSTSCGHISITFRGLIVGMAYLILATTSNQRPFLAFRLEIGKSLGRVQRGSVCDVGRLGRLSASNVEVTAKAGTSRVLLRENAQGTQRRRTGSSHGGMYVKSEITWA